MLEFTIYAPLGFQNVAYGLIVFLIVKTILEIVV